MGAFDSALRQHNQEWKVWNDIYQLLIAEYAHAATELEPKAWTELCKKLKNSAAISARVWFDDTRKGQ
jgi:accessory gene regulator protein AgrB